MEQDWHQQSVRALQLNGKGKSTQQAYTRAVRQLVDHYQKEPHLINEKELETYFLYRKEESQWAPGTMQICYYGIRFFLNRYFKENGICSN